MKHVTGLRCRECAREYPIAPEHVCELCFGPLEVAYDYDAIRSEASRPAIAAGPDSLWRYEALLPAPVAERTDLGSGRTRLRPAPRLAAELGLRSLWLKDDGGNPTHSFKDRVVTVALSVARSFGFGVAACASTGNLANAVAAYAAGSGMESVVFIPAGLESGKVVATTVYGGTVIEIDGSYDDVNRLCAELSATKHWAFVNVNLRPYYAEGSKTLAFETAEQLGWRAPDAVVVPMASGALLTKIGKGLDEMHRVGLLDEVPHTVLHGAQAAGCAPIVNAFESESEEIAPVKPATIAKSLAIGNPADGYYALKAVRASGGSMTSVPESDVVTGIELLARTEGIFTETAGGVTIAALERLAASGAITPEQDTVALITGVGLKTLEALGSRPATTVAAKLEDVLDALEGMGR